MRFRAQRHPVCAAGTPAAHTSARTRTRARADAGRGTIGVARAVLSRLRENAEPAVVLEPSPARPSRPCRIHRLEPGTAALQRAGTMRPRGPGEAVDGARNAGPPARSPGGVCRRRRGHLARPGAVRAGRFHGRTPGRTSRGGTRPPPGRSGAGQGRRRPGTSAGKDPTRFSRILIARCTAASRFSASLRVLPVTSRTPHTPRAGQGRTAPSGPKPPMRRPSGP